MFSFAFDMYMLHVVEENIVRLYSFQHVEGLVQIHVQHHMIKLSPLILLNKKYSFCYLTNVELRVTGFTFCL